MVYSRKIPVAQLRVGMYVSKLDREWLDTPFLMQGFLIETEDDIDIVAEYCEHIWVDERPAPLETEEGKLSGMRTLPPVKEMRYDSLIQDEHKTAQVTMRRSRSITKSVLDEVRLGGAINTTESKKVVRDCVQSVLRHPDALLWMSKIRNEQEYTAEHSLNVCILAVSFGRQLGYSESELEKLGLCGLLHDVGKLRVPQNIIDKPARLNTKEVRIMKAHTIHGRNLLLSTKNLYRGVVDVAYSHHERIDGNGYPRKLPGSGISMFSRIISLVDAYDAMTANRCYSSAKTSTEALKIIYKQRGKQFDEKLAIHFIKTIGLYPAGSIVELYSGEVGIVVESNQALRHLPRVIVVMDKNKEFYPQERLIDLSRIEKGEMSKRFLVKREWCDGSFGICLKDYHEKGLVLRM